MHSDDRGIKFPPSIAPFQMVIVPIIFKGKEEEIIRSCKEIKSRLDQKGYRILLDDRELTPGNKYYEWELKGIPLRIEIGPKEVEQEKLTLALRRSKQKLQIKVEKADEKIDSMLTHYAQALLREANRFIKQNTHQVLTLQEAKGKKGLIKLPWCGKAKCGKAVEEALHMNTLGTPLDEDPTCKNKEACPICGKSAQNWVRFAKLY
jgi:prolyl-tRNA synthetase